MSNKLAEDMTIEEMLALWHSQDCVVSCNMAGMGPGYEQCIQLAAFAMIDTLHLEEIDWENSKVLGGDLNDKLDDILHTNPDVSPGMTGAQVEAAKNLAYIILRLGYGAAVKSIPEDREILVSKVWPITRAQLLVLTAGQTALKEAKAGKEK